MPAISTNNFTWVPAEAMFVADASDLGDLDLGAPLALTSGRTGETVRLDAPVAERDADQDIAAWVFRPAAGYTGQPFTVHVLND